MVESETLEAVSITQPPLPTPPFVVKDISITMEPADGFAREAALAQAARQGLPTAITQLGIDPDEAGRLAKTVGNAMGFVKSYTIGKELLVPAYSLMVTLTFDQAKLVSNFGQKIKAAPSPTVPVSSSQSTGEGMPEDATSLPETTLPAGAQQIVAVTVNGAGAQDKLFQLLATKGYTPQWHVLRKGGGEIILHTALEGDALLGKLQADGFGATHEQGVITLGE